MLRKEKGITLIALVVTIVVLLILAGVSINLVLGNNGIINKSKEARDATRYGSIMDEYELYKADNFLGTEIGEGGSSFSDFLNVLKQKGLIDDDDIAQINSENKLTISDKYEISFEKTLGQVYSDNDIGKKITYSANGQNDWIIFGKDEDGNILITTKAPIDNGFTLNGTASAWLTYENDLKDACSGYGKTIQRVDVISRSITMDDINYVAGFTKPEFETFTFGAEQNYAEKEVNYYYPSTSAASNNYWQNPATASESFENDWYGYYYDEETGEYLYYGADTGDEDIPATDRNIKTDNLKYICGETRSYAYVVASRSVNVYADVAGFRVAVVYGGGVNTHNGGVLCSSSAGGGRDFGGSDSVPVRPVVVLPSDLKVNETADGYDLISEDGEQISE